jgi:hypothetical protein
MIEPSNDKLLRELMLLLIIICNDVFWKKLQKTTFQEVSPSRFSALSCFGQDKSG